MWWPSGNPNLWSGLSLPNIFPWKWALGEPLVSENTKMRVTRHFLSSPTDREHGRHTSMSHIQPHILILCGRYYYAHFTDMETLAQRNHTAGKCLS